MSWVNERRAFAESVGTAAERALGGRTPAWRPGAPCDDREPALDQALGRLGWATLAEDPDLLRFAGPASVELGRRLAPFGAIDGLLGGPLLAGELVRYGGAGRAVTLADGEIAGLRLRDELPLAYGDSIGVHRVQSATETGRVRGEDARRRIAAWIAASVGYAAGIGDYALTLTTGYAQQRRAFGTSLSGLAPVQQLLADAATSVRGLTLLAGEQPGPEALAFAGPALFALTAACQQVTGAIGFTLEYPLQAAYRRSRALMVWHEAALDALAGASA